MRGADIALDLLDVPIGGINISDLILDCQECSIETESREELEYAELHTSHSADVHQCAVIGKQAFV